MSDVIAKVAQCRPAPGRGAAGGGARGRRGRTSRRGLDHGGLLSDQRRRSGRLLGAGDHPGRGEATEQLELAALPHLVPDLPVSLWWPGEPDTEGQTFARLLEHLRPRRPGLRRFRRSSGRRGQAGGARRTDLVGRGAERPQLGPVDRVAGDRCRSVRPAVAATVVGPPGQGAHRVRAGAPAGSGVGRSSGAAARRLAVRRARLASRTGRVDRGTRRRLGAARACGSVGARRGEPRRPGGRTGSHARTRRRPIAATASPRCRCTPPARRRRRGCVLTFGWPGDSCVCTANLDDGAGEALLHTRQMPVAPDDELLCTELEYLRRDEVYAAAVAAAAILARLPGSEWLGVTPRRLRRPGESPASPRAGVRRRRRGGGGGGRDRGAGRGRGGGPPRALRPRVERRLDAAGAVPSARGARVRRGGALVGHGGALGRRAVCPARPSEQQLRHGRAAPACSSGRSRPWNVSDGELGAAEAARDYERRLRALAAFAVARAGRRRSHRRRSTWCCWAWATMAIPRRCCRERPRSPKAGASPYPPMRTTGCAGSRSRCRCSPPPDGCCSSSRGQGRRRRWPRYSAIRRRDCPRPSRLDRPAAHCCSIERRRRGSPRRVEAGRRR